MSDETFDYVIIGAGSAGGGRHAVAGPFGCRQGPDPRRERGAPDRSVAPPLLLAESVEHSSEAKAQHFRLAVQARGVARIGGPQGMRARHVRHVEYHEDFIFMLPGEA